MVLSVFAAETADAEFLDVLREGAGRQGRDCG
jgi:hypothetical protein